MLTRFLTYIYRSLFIFLSFFLVVGICSCTFLSRKIDRLSSGISFNYPGLRLESRNINISSVLEAAQVIVCFGDSVTFGWNLKISDSYPSIVEDLIQKSLRDVVIINSGIGGNTTSDGLKRINRDVIRYSPDIAVVNFGLNDAMLDSFTTDHSNLDELYFEKDGRYIVPNISLPEFEENYREIISRLDSNNIEVVIIGLNPVLENYPESESEEFRKKQKEIFKVYNERIKSISEDTGSYYIDLFSIFGNIGENKNLLQGDGIHPSADGQALIAQNINDYLKKSGFIPE